MESERKLELQEFMELLQGHDTVTLSLGRVGETKFSTRQVHEMLIEWQTLRPYEMSKKEKIKTHTVDCPYCRAENDIKVKDEGQIYGYGIEACGSCGGRFVIEHFASVNISIKRIEGEEKYAKEKMMRADTQKL